MELSKMADLALIGAMKQLDWRREVYKELPNATVYKKMVEQSEEDVAQMKQLIFKIKSGVMMDEDY